MAHSPLIISLEDFIDDVPQPPKEDNQPTLPDGKDLDAEKPIQGYDGNVDIIIDIDNGRDERTTQMWEAEKLKIRESLSRLELVLKTQHNFIEGQEGFTSFIANSLTAIPNILGHITRLFYTTLVYGWRDFKRGELTAYHASNCATMSRIYHTNYYEFRDLDVDTPQGMKGTYTAALKSLQDFFNALDMPKRVKKMYDQIVAIRKDIIKSNGDFRSYVQDFTRAHKSTDVDKAFANTSKFFTTDKEDGGTFGKLFSNMGEFENVIKNTMNMDTELRMVAGVHDKMNDMKKEIDIIIQNGDKLSKQQVNDLVEIVRFIGDTFDQYATCLNDLSRIDHNMTEVVKTLRRYIEK